MLNWLHVLLTFVESKEAKPINFIISISSSVLPSKSSSVIWRSLLFVSFVSFFSSSLLSFSREGEGDVDLCRLGDLERLLWGDRERLLLLSLSRDRDLSRRLRSLSRDVDRDRLRSLNGSQPQPVPTEGWVQKRFGGPRGRWETRPIYFFPPSISALVKRALFSWGEEQRANNGTNSWALHSPPVWRQFFPLLNQGLADSKQPHTVTFVIPVAGWGI